LAGAFLLQKFQIRNIIVIVASTVDLDRFVLALGLLMLHTQQTGTTELNNNLVNYD
jgi:hypothetical protein